MSLKLIKFLPILSLLVLSGTFASCIKDEKPNIEVDILEVTARTGSILSVTINSENVDVYVAPEVDPADISLSMVLSQGATIAPDPELISGYSDPRVFRVTSEDGNWKKDYTVTVRFNEIPRRFDFENWLQPDRMRYKIPYETSPAGDQMLIWACGNEAFNFLTNKQDDYTVFPTLPTTEAFSGKSAAMLVTRLTGQLDRPIAAGNLFIGQFDSSLRDPRESTMFGLPFTAVPLKIRGMYKYRSGGATLLSGEPDCCRIQAVLYRSDENTRHLNGLNIRTSPNIIARAELTGDGTDTPGNGYIPFEITFEYVGTVDPALLRRGGYNLALIFTASSRGDVYDGAPGSTLLVDDVEIICNDDK